MLKYALFAQIYSNDCRFSGVIVFSYRLYGMSNRTESVIKYELYTGTNPDDTTQPITTAFVVVVVVVDDGGVTDYKLLYFYYF